MNRDDCSQSIARNQRLRFSHQRGLSLIELMIGLLVGLILLGGVLQTMLASKEASSARQSMAVVTDNARFLFDFMARDLRMAGRGEDPPLDYSNNTLTAYYRLPTASGQVATGYRFDSGTGEVIYTRQEGAASASGGVLIDGVSNFEVSFGVATASGVNYTAFGTTPADMSDVVAVRTRVTFEDTGVGGFSLNVASTPIVSTVALRNQVATLLK